jgi:hypothetical protein
MSPGFRSANSGFSGVGRDRDYSRKLIGDKHATGENFAETLRALMRLMTLSE